MNQKRFEEACGRVSASGGPGGIGTLGEKALHAIMKYYIEPDASRHEVPVGRYVADIQNREGIFEIQTRQFSRLRGKLDTLLEEGPVTIVYPVATQKWLFWVEPASGEVIEKRKSPRKGCKSDVFYELYQIKQSLTHPNFSLRVILMEMEEVRLLDGWGPTRKKGASRMERIPTLLQEDLFLKYPSDYCLLLPDELHDTFTSKDYAQAARVPLRTAHAALNVLRHLGIIHPVGKAGRLNLYTIDENI